MKTKPNERLINLTDGVFAIVMTILVLELSIPVIARGSGGATLTARLIDMWPKYLSYVVSFLLLGLFWGYHNEVFKWIKREDARLFWLSLLFLMAVALVPFAASLAAEHWNERVAVALYGVMVLVPFLLLWFSFLYAIGGGRLVDHDFNGAIARTERSGGLVIAVYFLIAICLSFAQPLVSLFLYGLMPLYFLVASLLGREGLSARRRSPGQNQVGGGPT